MAVKPWKSIWFRPREAMRLVCQTKPLKGIYLFALLIGLANLLPMSAPMSAVEGWTMKQMLFSLFFTFFVIAPIYGLISICLHAFFLKIALRLLNGEHCYKHICASIMWSAAPLTLLTLYWVVIGFVQGIERYFEMWMPHTHKPQMLFYFGISLWSFIILLVATSEVGQVSKWRAFFALILSNIILALVFAIILLVLGAILEHIPYFAGSLGGISV